MVKPVYKRLKQVTSLHEPREGIAICDAFQGHESMLAHLVSGCELFVVCEVSRIGCLFGAQLPKPEEN